MSRFLDDEEIGPAIRHLMKGKRVRCAVAFWGVGAARALFAGGRPPAGARLICDISMGGTNPCELKALGAPYNKKLRHVSGLHAKVYMSDEGLIVGSSNASNNGIGFIDVARLVEAGTFHPPGSDAYKQARIWLKKLWKRSKVVDESALELAGKTWLRKPGTGIAVPGRAPDPKSLLEIVAADPGRFRGVGFVLSSGTCTEDDRDETARAVIAKDDALPVPLLSGAKREELAGWSVGNTFGNWTLEDISAWPERFICIHKGAKGRISYWFYWRAHTAMLQQDRGMLFARRPGSLRRDLGFRHGCETMARTDRKRLKQLFGRIGESGHKLYESSEKFALLLAGAD